jgi:hypothetical protein
VIGANGSERMMPTTIGVMYENVDDATFDLEYLHDKAHTAGRQ